MVYWTDGSKFSFLICPPWLSRDKEIANWSGFQGNFVLLQAIHSPKYRHACEWNLFVV